MLPLKDLGRYGTVGIELLIWILLGTFGGKWLDARFSAHGWLQAAGFLFGVFAGFYSLWKAATGMQREMDRQDRQDKDPRGKGP
jgi:ATP synthase protein I